MKVYRKKEVRDEAIFLLDVAVSYARESIPFSYHWRAIQTVADDLGISTESDAFDLADLAYRIAYQTAPDMITA